MTFRLFKIRLETPDRKPLTVAQKEALVKLGDDFERTAKAMAEKKGLVVQFEEIA
jgi:hypothetical protein